MPTIRPAIQHSILLPLVGMAVVAWLGCGEDRPARPDLVLVTIDRLAADRLSCFGGPRDAGSSLCDLAENGTLFAWATTPSLDEAVAAASVLTGSPPAIHGLDERGLSFLSDHHETIAESLARAGYTTAAFVASPRLNRSRRLDQGFDHYADRAASTGAVESSQSIAHASSIQKWIEAARPPYFVWIHARSEFGLVELDRLVDRLSGILEHGDQGPGILVAALAGEPEPLDAAQVAVTSSREDGGIRLRTHRIPLFWRPPSSSGPRGQGLQPGISSQLASLLDVAPTLRAAAQLAEEADTESTLGRDLAALAQPRAAPSRSFEDPGERFLLLPSPPGSNEVGLASGPHLYVRRASLLDGSGRAVPTSELKSLAPRFTTIAPLDTGFSRIGQSAALAATSWRTDVLSAESPVPRLEFHLARRLAGKAPSLARE
jgi:hypothetical protein